MSDFISAFSAIPFSLGRNCFPRSFGFVSCLRRRHLRGFARDFLSVAVSAKLPYHVFSSVFSFCCALTVSVPTTVIVAFGEKTKVRGFKGSDSLSVR